MLDGIGTYTQALQVGLRSRGHVVEGLSFPSLGELTAAFQEGKPHVVPYPVAALGCLMTRGRMRHSTRADVFHVTDYRVLPMRCPVVATLYDAIALKHPEFASSSLRALKNFVQRSVARYADHVIAISQFAAAEVIEYYGIAPARVSVVYCGVDKNWLEPMPAGAVENALLRRGLRAGYFLSVGTLQPRKNFDRIVDAYLKLPGCIRKERQLVLIGRLGWGCEALVARLKTLRSSPQVVWLSDVCDPRELRCLYGGAGVFVFPSLCEGFGLPIVEAFASKVPVITSNTTSLPEVSGGAAIEIDPQSTDELAGAMEFLAGSDSERNRRAEMGAERASHLTWDLTVERTLQVYESVA